MYSSQREDVQDENDAKEFPILCETCLGDNPYVRMTREAHGKACKICDRPFTIFRWRPGSDARYKKTEVCPTCAKLKNVCQTCILDLQYGLPVQVRDSVLEDHERVKLATEDANRGVQIEKYERDLENGVTSSLPYGKVPPSSLLERLARRAPYYQRNRAHICSFWVRGECNRGSTCPYRHEMPVTGELAKQNIKDRFHGVNDPVANKMMRRVANPDGAAAGGGYAPPPPADPTVTTLWMGGLDDSVTEDELRSQLYQYGAIGSIRIVPIKGCAFVAFTNRKAAEDASNALRGMMVLRGMRLRVDWGKSTDSSDARVKRAPPGMHVAYAAAAASASSSSSAAAAASPAEPAQVYLAPPPGMDQHAYYPSMDSRQQASKLYSRED